MTRFSDEGFSGRLPGPVNGRVRAGPALLSVRFTPVILKYFVDCPIFPIPEKNDINNDPLQGRSLLKQANYRGKPNGV